MADVAVSGAGGAGGAGGTARRAARRRRGIGVALGAGELCAVRLGAPHAPPFRAALAPLADDATAWPALADALRAAADALGGGEVSVALLPPLVQLRRVELPPLRPDEARRVLARGAARWFLGAREPQVTAVEVRDAARRRPGAAAGPAPVVAAAAPARLLEAVHRAAGGAGLAVRTIVPAAAAWRQAALALWPALGAGAGDVLVHHGERTELLQLERGRLAGVRHLRAGAADAARVLEAVAERARAGPAGPAIALAALGAPADRRALAVALAAHGAAPAPPPDRWRDLPDDAPRLAAAFAVRGAGLELLPEPLRAARRRRSGRAAVWMAAAALLLLAVAGALELWGLRRELAAVRAERAALRPRVADAAAARADAERRVRQLRDLAAAEGEATRWAHVVAALGEHLPDDAWLVALHGRGDSVTVEGLAGSAAGAVEGVAGAPGIAGVRTTAPVRPDLGMEDGLERFTLAARLAPPVGPVTPPAAAAARRTPPPGRSAP